MWENSDILCEESLIVSVINLFEEEVTQKSNISQCWKRRFCLKANLSLYRRVWIWRENSSFFLLFLLSHLPSPSPSFPLFLLPSLLSPPLFLPLLSRFDTIPLIRFIFTSPPSFSILFNEILASWVGILLPSPELKKDAHVARGRALVSGPF